MDYISNSFGDTAEIVIFINKSGVLICKMANIYDVDTNQLIENAAEELKKLGFKKPIWSDFVKTGVHKEKPPINPDWWYFRLAAVLRSVYRMGPIGTSKLRTKYGGKKNRGHRPEKTFKGSGSIIRKALQQLEESGFVQKNEKGVHKGRIITPKGKSFLDKIAVKMYKPTGKTRKAAAEMIKDIKEKEAVKEPVKEAAEKKQSMPEEIKKAK